MHDWSVSLHLSPSLSDYATDYLRDHPEVDTCQLHSRPPCPSSDLHFLTRRVQTIHFRVVHKSTNLYTMDSPLLPTLKRNPDMTTSPTGLMGNMTLEPMSPSDGDSFAYGSGTGGSSLAQSSHLSSQSQSSRPHSQSHSHSLAADETNDESDVWGEHTPQPKRKTQPRFSLFAAPADNQRPAAASKGREALIERSSESIEEGYEEEEEEQQPIPRAAGVSESSTARDDKLRESLYELRQMNEVFDGFLNALEAARGHNEVRRPFVLLSSP